MPSHWSSPSTCTKARAMCLTISMCLKSQAPVKELKHKTQQNTQPLIKTNTFPKCHPTTRAPQKWTLKLKPFSSLSFSRAFLAQVKARVSMIMEPSTRHKKMQRRTINCTRSLWTWVCACPGFVADVTDPFDHDSSETMGNDWQSNTCPTVSKVWHTNHGSQERCLLRALSKQTFSRFVPWL